MNILFECLAGDAGGGVFMSITYQDIALILCQNKSEVKEVNHIIFLNDCIMTMPFFVRRASGVDITWDPSIRIKFTCQGRSGW